MICPKCGKKLPDSAVKCNKCGEVFKEIKKNKETEEFLKKEKLKASERAEKLNQKKENAAKRAKILKIVLPCVAVILVAAILATVLITGKKKKELEEIKRNTPELLIEYTFKDVSDDEALIKLGDINISKAEYEFFYRQSFSNVQNNALLAFKQFVGEKLGDKYDDSKDYYNEYYAEYQKGRQNLFDFKKPIDQQSGYATDENGSVISWQEFIRKDAINTLTTYRVKYALAQKAGITLTDDIRYQVYNHIEGLRDATSGGYQSLNQYLQLLFGPSCDEDFFKNELIREYIASKYDLINNIKLSDLYSDKEVNDMYQKNKADYDYIDLIVYEVAGENAKEVADKISAATKSISEFSDAIRKYQNKSADKSDLPQVPKQYIDQQFSKKLGSWAYDSKRKAGDKAVFETINGYTVAVIQTPAYTLHNSVSYREITFSKIDENGILLSEDKQEKARQTANEIYTKWKEGNATEDSFSYFALTKSQSSSAQNGGLVPFVSADTLDKSLKEWLTDSSRKAGDTQLIETDSGVSIVYYLKDYGDYWNYAIRSQKAGESAEEDYNSKKAYYAESFDSNSLSDAEQKIITDMNAVYFGI